MITPFVFAVLLGADGPAAAEQPAPEEPKMICRRIPELGSRLRVQRVCKTKQQWADEREQNRQLIDRAQATRTSAGGN
jgi:predicted secreted protein